MSRILRVELNTNLLESNEIELLYKTFSNDNEIKYNKGIEAIYYDCEVEYIPMDGQRVSTKWGYCIVDWSCYDLNPTFETYFDVSRIIVIEE